MGEVMANDAIQGFSLLQQSLSGIAERKQREKLQLEEQEWRTGEAEKTRAAELERLKISEAGATKRAGIAIAPAMRKLSMEEQQIKRDLEAGLITAEQAEQMGYGESLSGRQAIERMRSGHLGEVKVDTYKYLTEMAQKAATSGDTKLMDSINKQMETLFKASALQTYNEEKSKLQAQYDAGKEFVKEKVSYEDYEMIADKVLKATLPSYSLRGEERAGWFDKDPSGPLMKYAVNNNIPETKLDEVRVGIAQELAASDVRFAKETIAADGSVVVTPNNSAYRQAQKIFDMIFMKGRDGFYDVTVDGKGNVRSQYKEDEISIDTAEYLEAQNATARKKYIELKTPKRSMKEEKTEDKVKKIFKNEGMATE